MLSKENFTKERIEDLRRAGGADPSIIERTIFAFGLLEALAKTGMRFVFKGGTSLMLILDEPKRLSTDIDIVVEPDADIDAMVKEASRLFPFVDVEEQVRQGRNGIVKRHFKFAYESPVTGKPLTTLLDVLYEDNHYTALVEREVSNSMLLTEGEPTLVLTPTPEGMLGDKLTAFAPHTTGIPLGIGKDLEVMKQFYDVSMLIGACEDFGAVADNYMAVSEAEVRYRGESLTSEDCLNDTIAAALAIASRGRSGSGDYDLMVRGMRGLRNHVFSSSFSAETAAQMAPEVAYLAACILSGDPFFPVERPEEFSGEGIEGEGLKALRYLRKVNPESYAYAVKLDRILSSHR